MKLSDWARTQGISYLTTWRWFKTGKLPVLVQAFAREQGWAGFDVVAEIGSGLNGKRKKRLRGLRDPKVSRIVVEHWNRLARFGFEMVEAALAAAGKRVVVVEEGEVTDDLGRDLLEILPSACGRRSALEAMGCG